MPTTATPAIHTASAHAAAAVPVTAMLLSNGRTREVAACYGVACHAHAECARYAAVTVVHLVPKAPRTIGRCITSDQRMPMFLEVAA